MGAITNGLAAHGGLRPGLRHLLHVLRLHEEHDPARGADEAAVDLRLHPRLGGARRGRADPPADRAPGRAARDPGPRDDPPGRRERGRRDLAGRARAGRGPDGDGAEPPGPADAAGLAAGRARRLRAGRRRRLRPHRHRRRGAHRARRPRAAGGGRRLRPGGQHALHGALPRSRTLAYREEVLPRGAHRAGLGRGGEPLRVGRVDRAWPARPWRSTASASRRRATRRCEALGITAEAVAAPRLAASRRHDSHPRLDGERWPCRPSSHPSRDRARSPRTTSA